MSALRKPVTVVERAVTHIITYHPFYASILLKRPLIPRDNLETACVTASGQIYYSRAWFDSMPMKEVAFVLAHECMHYMFVHSLRRGHRPARDWNIACDAVINEMLIECKLGEMPTGKPGIRWPGAALLNAEEVYEQMKKEKAFPPPGSSQPGGDWAGDDIDESEQLDEGQRSVIEAEARVEMRQAMDSAKRMGGMPATLERLIEQLLFVPTPWYEYLLPFFMVSSDNDYSYAAFDRRFIHCGMYLPWYTGEGMAKAVIIVDVSGSISNAELREFSGHVNKVLDTCQPRELYVIYVHDEVAKKIDRYEPLDYPIVLECDESGGTDMTQGIHWVMDNHPDTDAIVVLTDGYTPFGNDCGIPTFWAITSNIKSPWGQSVKLELTA